MNKTSTLGALALSACVAGWANGASAAPCSSLTNTVVVSGSTAVKAALGHVAVALASAANPSEKLTIVYAGTGSCSGTLQIGADHTPTGACTPEACVTGTAEYWDPALNLDPSKPTVSSKCDLPAAPGQHVDVILSDVFKDSCEGLTDSSKLKDDPFVVIPFAFIVPTASSQTAIDAREAYYAYGKGMAGKVEPWVNESLLYRRNSGSGTQVTVFKNIHVPVGSSVGMDTSGTGKMLSLVAGGSNPQATLGFGGLDAVDTQRKTLTLLAYRHYDSRGTQTKYYWPDSNASSFDKINVRDGHYPLWGYEHTVLRLDSNGLPVSAAGKKLADYLKGTLPLPAGQSLVALEIQAGLIPNCAMEVSRTDDGGDFSVSMPTEPCGCFYEANVPQGSTTCKACTADAECSTGQKCRHSYCEAR